MIGILFSPDGLAGIVLKSMHEKDLMKNNIKPVTLKVGDERHTDCSPSFDEYNPTYLINNWYTKNNKDLSDTENVFFRIKYFRGIETHTDSAGEQLTREAIYDEYEFYVPKDKLDKSFNAGDYTDVQSNEIGEINGKWRKIQKIYSIVFYVVFIAIAIANLPIWH